jgi:hypothetical protein
MLAETEGQPHLDIPTVQYSTVQYRTVQEQAMQDRFLPSLFYDPDLLPIQQYIHLPSSWPSLSVTSSSTAHTRDTASTAMDLVRNALR